MIEKKILVKNLEVNYKVFGENFPNTQKPLLILHGWPSSSGKWQNIGELLAEKGLKIIIPDLPGFGKSQEPINAWNLDTYIEWIREFTEQVDDFGNSFYLLGHSFGGSLAVKFSVKYNQRVAMLFLVSASCIRKVTWSKKMFYRASKVVKVFSFLPYYALFRKAFYKFILRKSDYPYVQGIMKETYINVVSEDLSWRLSFVKVPTIILWGQKDAVTPLSDAQFIHERIRNSKLVVLPNVQHSLQLEAPEMLVQKILENLQ